METQTEPILPQTLTRIGIAAAHGGIEWKELLARSAIAIARDFGRMDVGQLAGCQS